MAQTTLPEVGRLRLRDIAGSGRQGSLETCSLSREGGGGVAKSVSSPGTASEADPGNRGALPPPQRGSGSRGKPEVSLQRRQEPPPGGPRVGLYPHGSGKPAKREFSRAFEDPVTPVRVLMTDRFPTVFYYYRAPGEHSFQPPATATS